MLINQSFIASGQTDSVQGANVQANLSLNINVTDNAATFEVHAERKMLGIDNDWKRIGAFTQAESDDVGTIPVSQNCIYRFNVISISAGTITILVVG